MVRDERWVFDESFPVFADTLESLQGFHRKTLENVDDYLFRKKWSMSVHLHLVHDV